VLRSLFGSFSLVGCLVLLAATAWAQPALNVQLDDSETLFAVVAAVNACGYDQELSTSAPVRAQVRTEIAQAVENSERAKSSLEELCIFYRDHQQANASLDLAQYISLALELGEPPAFTPKVKEADLPPDASYVLGVVPRLQRFYINADLHRIWQRHQAEYNALLDRTHGPIAQMLMTTDAYLRRVNSAANARLFVIYLEPLAAPSQVNSRNYGTDYFLAISAGQTPLQMDAIRHSYLHYLFDPMVAQRGGTLQRLAPLLGRVAKAPMDDSFKDDVSLLLTESLIRAVEARLAVTGKNKEAENERQRLAQNAAQEGFVLAPYFERRLEAHERSDEGLQLAYPTWLHEIDVDQESKRASKIVFAANARPENVQRVAPKRLLDDAEKRFAAGDLRGATELAQRALDEKREDPARAWFVLAQVATANRDMEGARGYFQRSLSSAHEPHLIAWSHIYLGRICDLQEERAQAVGHYQAALEAGDGSPATRAAAERGLQQPYEPPNAKERAPAQGGDKPEPDENQDPDKD